MPRRSFPATKNTPVPPRADGVCENKTAFGERLRHLRTRAKLSPGALAEALGISPSAVYNWESGRTRPDVNNLPAICALLGVEPGALFADDPAGAAEEHALLKDFRKLDAPGRAFLRNTLKGLLELRESTLPKPEPLPVPELIVLPFAQDALAAGTGDPTSAFTVKKHIYVHASEAARRADRAFRVNGESMTPDYRDGDVVLVENVNGALRPGEIGAFALENELYIKEYRGDGLYSRNPAYPPRLFKDYTEIRLIGRVIGCLNDADRADAEEIRRFKEARA